MTMEEQKFAMWNWPTENLGKTALLTDLCPERIRGNQWCTLIPVQKMMKCSIINNKTGKGANLSYSFFVFAFLTH